MQAWAAPAMEGARTLASSSSSMSLAMPALAKVGRAGSVFVLHDDAEQLTPAGLRREGDAERRVTFYPSLGQALPNAANCMGHMGQGSMQQHRAVPVNGMNAAPVEPDISAPWEANSAASDDFDLAAMD